MAKALTDKRSYNNADLKPVQVMALKKRAKVLPKVTVRIGSRSFELPVDVHLVEVQDGFSFISLPAINALCVTSARRAGAPVSESQKIEAIAALRQTRTTKAIEKNAAAEMPEALAAALKRLPQGYKLVMKDGEYQLVKRRK